MTPERFSRLRAALTRRQPDLTVLMDSVNKSHNVSAILRTADAVALTHLHSVSTNAAMRRHHMIAGGARRWVSVVLHPTAGFALEALRKDGFRLVAAHGGDGARDFRDVDYTRKTALVVGAEFSGLSAETLAAADELIAIPMQGLVTSLNVSVATGAILLEAERQRRAAGMYAECRLSPEEFERILFEWCYPEIAVRCRKLARPYPPLSADGSFTVNPLLAP
ncbi:MAG: tRNA (guanosine(18)-2'-O)-methyltransferase TrmH [Gammaproteobacteria bacterium]